MMHTPDRPDADLGGLLAQLHLDIEDLIQLLRQARELQWSRGRRQRVEDADRRRAGGTHSDPTGDIATDSTRLRVRSAVLGSERLVNRMVMDVRRAVTGLERAIGEWENDPESEGQQP